MIIDTIKKTACEKKVIGRILRGTIFDNERKCERITEKGIITTTTHKLKICESHQKGWGYFDLYLECTKCGMRDGYFVSERTLMKCHGFRIEDIKELRGKE